MTALSPAAEAVGRAGRGRTPAAAPSLRDRLARLIVVALLPLVVLAAGLSYAGYRTDRARAAARTTDLARGMALAVERELRGMTASMEALAFSPSLAAGDLAAFRREADALVARHFPGAWIILLAPDGQQFLNTRLPPGAPLPVRPHMETTRQVVATGSPAVSDVYRGAVRGMHVVAVDVPVQDASGAVTHVLSLSPPLSAFAEMIRQQRPEPGWAVGVFDRRGTVVARVPDPEGRFTGGSASASFLPHLLARDEGNVGTRTLEGTPVFTSFSRPGPTGWSVAIGVPRADLHTPLWRSLAATAGASFLALLGALFLARAHAEQIARPVRALVDLAARGGAGVPPPLGLREADEVAGALAATETGRAESEERLRLAQEAGGVGVWRWVPATGETDLSDETHRIFGLPPGTIRTYGGWLALVHPDDRARLEAERDAAIRAREPFDLEFRATRADDGAERWIGAKGRADYDAEGRAVRVLGVNIDITARKCSEAALRDGERMLRLALDAADLGVWRWEVGRGTDGLEWDPRCKAMFGLPPDAPVDYAAWANAIPPEDRGAAEAGVARALDPADPHDAYACEYRAVHPDGRVLRLAAAGRATFEPDPAAPAGRRAVRIVGTIRDVTEARRAEEARRRTDALMRTILETAPGLIFAKDRRGRMLLASPSVMALVGRPWAEVEGRTDLEFLADRAQAEAVMANDRRVMDSGEAQELEERVGGADGDARVWLSTKTPLRGADGTVDGLVGVSVEITGRKRAEERLRLVVDELNHRVKNTLATVQSIASQTLRGADPGVRRALEERLLALAAAHDVLTREAWTGANLDEVVAGVLAPHGGREDGRFRVGGPAVRLRPRAALAIAMGLHELATNALKYGALSAAAAGSGWVEIRWGVVGDGTPRLRLSWAERGGPPVPPPARRGFGTRLVERSLAQDLGGTVALDFAPGGVACAIEAPLAGVAAPAEVVPLPRLGGVGGD